MTATLPVAQSEIFYPSADGEPVAEAECQRAEQAQAQVEQLKARLRSLGVDVDTE